MLGLSVVLFLEHLQVIRLKCALVIVVEEACRLPLEHRSRNLGRLVPLLIDAHLLLHQQGLTPNGLHRAVLPTAFLFGVELMGFLDHYHLGGPIDEVVALPLLLDQLLGNDAGVPFQLGGAILLALYQHDVLF